MYPLSDITALEERKRRLRQRIGERREDCVYLAGKVSETVNVIDAWRERITSWAGLASVLFPFFLKTKSLLAPKKPAASKSRGLLHWVSLGWKLVKGLGPLTYAFRGE